MRKVKQLNYSTMIAIVLAFAIFIGFMLLNIALVGNVSADELVNEVADVDVANEFELTEIFQQLSEMGGEIVARLTEDVSVADNLVLEKGTLTIVSDGSTLQVSKIIVKNDATLNLGDVDQNLLYVETSIVVSENATLNILKGVTLQNANSAIVALGTSKINMFSGLIKDCQSTEDTLAAGITVKGSATLNMRGGEIKDCNAVNGAAIYVDETAKANISKGTISGNTSTCGAVYNKNIVSITGGTFTNNEATLGGAIYSEGGKLTIDNCVISNNIATKGAGVYVNAGKATILDRANIMENVGFGGGVYNNCAEVKIGNAARIYNNVKVVEEDYVASDIVNGIDGTLQLEQVATGIKTLDGKKIDGWYASAWAQCGEDELSENYYVAPQILTGYECELEIIASFGRYEVTFDYNFDGAELNSQKVLTGEVVARPQNPQREGSIFIGWFTEGTDTAYNFNMPIKKDTKIVAKWNTTVAFDLGYEGAEKIDSQVTLEGKKIVKPEQPSRLGYIFAGWYKLGEEKPFDFDRNITGATTLVAKWNVEVVYNGGFGNSNIFKQTILENTNAIEPTISRENYVFAGWYEFNKQEAFDFNTPVASKLFLYAKWNVAIDFELGYSDAAEEIATQVIPEGTKANLVEVERDSYIFDGWYNGEEKFDFAKDVETNVVLTAKWVEDFNNNNIADDQEARYTITYCDGVGGEIFEAQTIVVLEGLDVPVFSGVIKIDGYVLDGWTPVVSQKVVKDATYIAIWAEDINHNNIADNQEARYTVTYCDGVGNTVFESQTTVELVGLDTPIFAGSLTREGYEFVGWDVEVSNKVTGNVTYTAIWQEVENVGIEANIPTTYAGGLQIKTEKVMDDLIMVLPALFVILAIVALGSVVVYIKKPVKRM